MCCCVYRNGTSVISLMRSVEARASRLIEDPQHQSGNFSTERRDRMSTLSMRNNVELTEGEGFEQDCSL
jgi:hypothetical protein